MARFEEKEFSFSDINNGERYQNGDIVDAEAINKPIEASYYAQEKAKAAEVKADEALNKVNDSAVGEIALSAYPIGSVYISVSDVSPASLFGGTWEKIKDRFLLASGDTYALGASGGNANAVVVSHRHNDLMLGGSAILKVTGSGAGTTGIDTSSNSASPTSTSITTSTTGEDGTGKNMPPYLVVNVWKRVS